MTVKKKHSKGSKPPSCAPSGSSTLLPTPADPVREALTSVGEHARWLGETLENETWAATHAGSSTGQGAQQRAWLRSLTAKRDGAQRIESAVGDCLDLRTGRDIGQIGGITLGSCVIGRNALCALAAAAAASLPGVSAQDLARDPRVSALSAGAQELEALTRMKRAARARDEAKHGGRPSRAFSSRKTGTSADADAGADQVDPKAAKLSWFNDCMDSQDPTQEQTQFWRDNRTAYVTYEHLLDATDTAYALEQVELSVLNKIQDDERTGKRDPALDKELQAAYVYRTLVSLSQSDTWPQPTTTSTVLGV